MNGIQDSSAPAKFPGATSDHHALPEFNEGQAIEAFLFPTRTPHGLLHLNTCRTRAGEVRLRDDQISRITTWPDPTVCGHGVDLLQDCQFCERHERTIRPTCACHSPLCRLDHEEMTCAICLRSLCEEDAVETAKGSAHEECAERAYSFCYDAGDTRYPR